MQGREILSTSDVREEFEYERNRNEEVLSTGFANYLETVGEEKEQSIDPITKS